ncbi:thiamine pyrophosphate-dependent enzyme [Umezawaea sp.]|uniref:thiamine pyrophosphate-dependent enzyme n=1 Tax=Umezawaea sp. TaxID=1955258 RepID=UPI002ED4742F
MSERTGGDVLAEALVALGARTVFGPLALGPFEAVGRSKLRYVDGPDPAFTADGHARLTGDVTPLLLPGTVDALIGSAAVLAVGVREAPVPVKHSETVANAAEIAEAVARAWDVAATAPFGPVWVRVPEEVLRGRASTPSVAAIVSCPDAVVPEPRRVEEVARRLDGAERPVVVAGGGVLRGDARTELLALAETLGAPVVTTFGGKGAFPWEHPLSAQSWLSDEHTTRFLEEADLLLVVGSGLDTPRDNVVRVDVDPERVGENGVHGDARFVLAGLAETVRPRTGDAGEAAVRALLHLVRRPEPELEAIRAAVPDDSPTFWDRTVFGDRPWSAWDPRDSAMCGTPDGVGYALPAALGAAVALGDHVPVLAVSGGDTAALGLRELATARRHDLRVTWLVVDGEADLLGISHALGVPATGSTPSTVREDLAEALAWQGPHVVVLGLPWGVDR